VGTASMSSDSESEPPASGTAEARPAGTADPGAAAGSGAAEELARRLQHDLDVANDWHPEPWPAADEGDGDVR
jgi:hypothetical protein